MQTAFLPSQVACIIQTLNFDRSCETVERRFSKIHESGEGEEGRKRIQE